MTRLSRFRAHPGAPGRAPTTRLSRAPAAAALLVACGLVLPSVAAQAPAADAGTRPSASARPSAPARPPASAQASAIRVSAKQAGAPFLGIGAISGGGGNTRYLIDYPEPEQSQILDYLFKPHYGASLQMLKLEIGGDSSSSDGSEPSVEHTQGVVNCNVGYEWWLAKQALKRNPEIKLYGLQWTAPGWTARGSGANATIWSRNNVHYVIRWLECAKSEGLTISYLGGWDESGFNAAWYERMRAALNRHGFGSVQIVAADGHQSDHWAIARALAANKKFNAAVSIVGEHDSCLGGQYYCPSTPTAQSLHKPLMMAEVGGLNPNQNAANAARVINRMYIDGGMTGMLEWPLLSAMPAGLPHQNRGLVIAAQPWSGSYATTKLIWATAQTTQFVQPGWRYVKAATRMLGNSGSADTYVSPRGSNWTMVAENTGTAKGQHIAPQTVKVTLTGKLRAKTVHVWTTNLKSKNPAKWFVRGLAIKPVRGRFSYTIPPNDVVTFTSARGQTKAGGSPAAIPAGSPMPLPYSDPLDGSTNDGTDMPALLSPVDGSFEFAPCGGGRTGACLQQTTPVLPVLWHSNDLDYPYAIVGDPTWSDYTVSVDALITQPNGTAGVVGRFSNRASRLTTRAVGNAIGCFYGYLFDVTDSGHWQILRNRVTRRIPAVLAQGQLTQPLGQTWHTLSMTMVGNTISAAIDGQQVGSATDTASPAYTSGLAGIEAGAFTGTWPIDQYQNLSVTPAP